MTRTSVLIALAAILGFGTVPAWAGRLEDGDAAMLRGDPAAAIIAWSEALVDARARQDHPTEHVLLLKLASAQRDLGAITLARRVLDLARGQAAGPGESADVLVSLGLLDRHAGDLSAALSSFELAYSQYRKAEDPRGAVNALLNQSAVLLDAGQYAEAAVVLDRAASLAKALGDPELAADILVNRGVAARQAKDLRGARTFLEQALRELALAPPPARIDAWIAAAQVDVALGQDPEERLRRAHALATGAADHGRMAQIEQLRFRVARDAGDVPSAIRHLESAIRNLESAGRATEVLHARLDQADLQPPGVAEATALVKAASAVPDRRAGARALLTLAEAVETQDPARATSLVEGLFRDAPTVDVEVRWRGLALLGRARQRSGDLEGASSLYAESAARLQEARHTTRPTRDPQRENALMLAWADVELRRGRPLAASAAMAVAARLENPGLPPGFDAVHALAAKGDWLQAQVERDAAPSERSQELAKNLQANRVRFAAEVDRLRAQVSDLDARVRIAPEDLESVQADIPADAAVVLPLLLPERTVLLVFRRESLTLRESPRPAAETEATLARLTRALRAGLRDRALLDPLAEDLGKTLWAPIAADLDGVRVVAWANAGPLRALPMAMLRHEGQYLAERYATASLAHVGSLRAPGLPSPILASHLLLVGDPDGTLPGARAEVAAVGGRWPAAPRLVGQDATREAVLGNLGGRVILHLATHGRIDNTDPARSHLVLAGSPLVYGEIPGFSEALAHVRLAVLSACESGRPVTATSADVAGIQGLASQFRRAGIETLVASLWKVDDEGTRALMDVFYAALADGADVADSLRRAQLEALASSDRQTPWIWAAFVVSGAWER